MAIFRIVVFLIHAIVAAFAGMLFAVFSHAATALLALVALLAILFGLGSFFGVGGIAILKRRRRARR